MTRQPDRRWSLTSREREVLACLAEGLDNPAIAARLFISRHTLQHHLTAIYAKLGVTSRYQAIIYALQPASQKDGRFQL